MSSNPIVDHKSPMTALTTAILFIDIQPGIIDNSKTNRAADIAKAATALATLGRMFDIPMIASVVPMGEGDSEPVPELAEALDRAAVLPRHMANVFDDQVTRKRVGDLGRRDLVICGVVTEVAVLLAAYAGRVGGYEIHVPVDACGGYSLRTEEAAFRRIESFGAATASVATLGAVLCPDLGSPKGQEMMGVLMTVMR